MQTRALFQRRTMRQSNPRAQCWTTPTGRRCCYNQGLVTCTPVTPTAMRATVRPTRAIAVPFYGRTSPFPNPTPRAPSPFYRSIGGEKRVLLCPMGEDGQGACFDVLCLPMGDRWVCARTSAALYPQAYKSSI